MGAILSVRPQAATASSHTNDSNSSPNTGTDDRDCTPQELLTPTGKQKRSEEAPERPDIVGATLLTTVECEFTPTTDVWDANTQRDSMDPDSPQKRWKNKPFVNLNPRAQQTRQSYVDLIQSVTGSSVPYWACVPVNRRQKQMPIDPRNCSSSLLHTIVKCLTTMDYNEENKDKMKQPLIPQASTSPILCRETADPLSTATARHQADKTAETVDQGPSSRATTNASRGIDYKMQQNERPENVKDRLEASRPATQLTSPLQPEVNERSHKRRRMENAKKELEISQAKLEIARLQYEMDDD